jgi:hypothetical protein
MSTNRWSSDFLDPMRLVGDPLGDHVIAQVVDTDERKAVNQIMRSLVVNDDLVPDDLPPNVRDYLQDTAQLPAWADQHQIEVAQKTFVSYAPEIILLLFYASLPSAYAARKGAQVLAITRRLEQGYIHRRIIETAQFIVDVMSPGGLAPRGRGIRAAQKVRLMHAVIRHYIHHEDRWQVHWDHDWGTPINQEDLAGTLMTFSSVVIDGMQRFNLRLRPQQAEAYLHTWKVIGDLLGLRSDLLPLDVADARRLRDAIFQRQWAPSQSGNELTAALLAFLQHHLPGMLHGLPSSALRYFRGDHVADMLNVGPADWTTGLLKIENVFFGLGADLSDASHGIRHMARWMNLQLLNGVLSVERDGNRPPFRIPRTLAPSRLRIQPSPDDPIHFAKR